MVMLSRAIGNVMPRARFTPARQRHSGTSLTAEERAATGWFRERILKG